MLEKALAGFEKSRAHLYPPSVSFYRFLWMFQFPFAYFARQRSFLMFFSEILRGKLCVAGRNWSPRACLTFERCFDDRREAHPPAGLIRKDYERDWRAKPDGKVNDTKLMDITINNDAKEGWLYILPKLYKKGCSCKTVMSGCDTQREKTRDFLSYHLKPVCYSCYSSFKW